MSNEYANCLTCPITYSIFEDPVIAEDGHTYERSAIVNWIQCGGTSPINRTPITIEGLRPNVIVRGLVEKFRQVMSKQHYKFKLGVDIERNRPPFFETTGKRIYNAQWIGYLNGPPIVLLELLGARAKKEASYYEQLSRHPYIVYTYGLVESTQKHTNYVILLQEKAPKGNLLHFLNQYVETKPHKPLRNLLLNHIFMQIINAMIYLLEKEIIHGDLACRNILIFHIDEDQPERTLVKLTDFGISRGNSMYSKIDAVQTVLDVIPVRTTPPEVFQGEPISEKTDIYAMGILMWEAFSYGSLPWEEIMEESIVREKVIKGERLSRPVNCKSDRQWELILKCMSQHAEDRPTFQELKDQLKEFLVPEIETSTNSKNSINEQQEKMKHNDTKCLLNKTDSDSCSSKTSLPTNVNVKSLCQFFQQEINRYPSSPNLSMRPSSNDPKKIKVLPRKDLIKLTKWH